MSTAMKESQIQEFAIWDTSFRNSMGWLQILEDFVAVLILVEFECINVHAINIRSVYDLSLSFQYLSIPMSVVLAFSLTHM